MSMFNRLKTHFIPWFAHVLQLAHFVFDLCFNQVHFLFQWFSMNTIPFEVMLPSLLVMRVRCIAFISVASSYVTFPIAKAQPTEFMITFLTCLEKELRLEKLMIDSMYTVRMTNLPYDCNPHSFLCLNHILDSSLCSWWGIRRWDHCHLSSSTWRVRMEWDHVGLRHKRSKNYDQRRIYNFVNSPANVWLLQRTSNQELDTSVESICFSPQNCSSSIACIFVGCFHLKPISTPCRHRPQFHSRVSGSKPIANFPVFWMSNVDASNLCSIHDRSSDQQCPMQSSIEKMFLFWAFIFWLNVYKLHPVCLMFSWKANINTPDVLWINRLNLCCKTIGLLSKLN